MAIRHPAPVRGEAEKPEGRMMGRVVHFLRAAKRIEARISDSLVGDAIGGLCLVATIIVITIGAGVLQ